MKLNWKRLPSLLNHIQTQTACLKYLVIVTNKVVGFVSENLT